MNFQEPLETVRSFWIFLSFFYTAFRAWLLKGHKASFHIFGAFGVGKSCLLVIIIKNRKLLCKDGISKTINWIRWSRWGDLLWIVQNVKCHKNGIISNKHQCKCNQWKCLIYLTMLEFAWNLFYQTLNRLIWNFEMHDAQCTLLSVYTSQDSAMSKLWAWWILNVELFTVHCAYEKLLKGRR